MKNIDIDRVEHLYYTCKKSATEIGVIFGCSPVVIYDRMEKNGMQRRTLSEARRLQRSQTKIQLDLAELVRLYFEEYLSLAAVAERLGISCSTVRRRLINAGYAPRKTSGLAEDQRRSRFTDAEIQEMKRLYCEEEQSSSEIADQYDCSDATIRGYLKRSGVRLRAGKEAQALRRKRENEQSEMTRESASAESESKGIPSNLKVAETACKGNNATQHEREHSTRTYTPPKRVGKVFDPIPLLRPEEVTPERILQFYRKDGLLIDDIAVICSLSNVEVYNILQEAGRFPNLSLATPGGSNP